MNLLTVSNFVGITAAGVGGAVIAKGHEDYKKDKTSGIARMIFGTAIIGIGCGYSIYNTINQPLTNENEIAVKIACTNSQWDENCTDVIDFVHNFLKNGNLSAFNNNTKEINHISMNLTETYIPESTVCVGDNFNLFCNVSMKNISILNGTDCGEIILNQVDKKSLQSISGSKILKFIFNQDQESGFIDTTLNLFKSIFSKAN